MIIKMIAAPIHRPVASDRSILFFERPDLNDLSPKMMQKRVACSGEGFGGAL